MMTQSYDVETLGLNHNNFNLIDLIIARERGLSYF